jgi:hypothetical protein
MSYIIKYLVGCIFLYFKLAGVVLLLGTEVLLLIKAVRAAVNLIALWPTGKVDH